MSNRAKVLLICCVDLSMIGCLPIKQLQLQQQSNLLTTQIQQTSRVLTLLKTTPDPEHASHFSVFVPIQMLNNVFAQADNLYFDPPDIKNTRIVLNQFRTHFDAGLPYLDLSASACTISNKPGPQCGDIKVTLRTTAFVDIEPVAAQGLPGEATVSIQIVDVVPDVKVGIFDFALRGFVQNLIKVNLSKLVTDHVPKMTIPLQVNNHLAYAGGAVPADIPTPRDSSAILGNISTPSLSKDVSLNVGSMLFLQDGAHIFLLVR